MDFKLGPINLNAVAQGVGGFVFGSENSTSNVDSYVERLLDRISNGVLADDRRAAMTELQAIVAESRDAQLAFGAMGFPVLMSVLKEERDDVEMVRGALETFVGALNPIEHARGPKNDIQPDALNADLLSRELESTAVLLSLLSEDDFYIRYYTLQLLTALLTKSPNRLQEAILSVPRGITQLMDMLMDREVIRNEALLLLTYLTREAEEIQKIVVFEGAFEKIFSIVKEEGGSEGGVVVQDCLELLNNLLRNNISNQIFLKETLGFDPLVSIFKLRKGSAYNFSQQKTVNLLSALSTIELLLNGGSKNESGKDANRLSNQTIFAQKKMMDYLLLLGVESKWAPLAIRSLALHCVGDLVVGHPQNLDILANKKIGDDPHFEPALNAILQTILRTSSVEEFMSAEYVLKCFCEKNTDGQTMLVSTITHQPYLLSDNTVDGDANMPFGRILLRGFIISETDGDIKMCSRAASVLYHLLKDNNQCKERLLQVELETPIQLLGSHEPLIHRILRYLSLASLQTKDNVQANKVSPGKSYIEPIILRSLITWLADCPNAVHRVLELPAHINYLIELISNPSSSVYVRGLASTLLGECVLYNRKSKEHSIDSFAIADSINQKIGLAVYFSRFEEMQKSILSLGGTLATNPRPLKRNSAANLMEIEVVETNGGDQEQEHPILKLMFDLQFVNFLKSLEIGIRESIVDIFSRPKNNVAIMPLELEQQDGERDADYIKRLKSFVEQQCFEMQELVSRNALLADGLAKTSEFDPSTIEPKIKTSQERVQSEYLSRDLQQATQRIEKLKMEKAKIESELSNYKNLALKFESDLKSLSDAYNSLEQVNVRLETEVKALRQGHVFQDLETIKAEAREEAQKESETELNDLLVCLGQEQSKVEKLSARLMDLGEDVDGLLEGIGDETGIPDDGSEEDED